MSVVRNDQGIHWSAYIGGALALATVIAGTLITLKTYNMLPSFLNTKHIEMVSDALGKYTALALLFFSIIFGVAGTYKLSQINSERAAEARIDQAAPAKPDLTNHLYILSGRIGANHNDDVRVNARRNIITPLQEKLRSGEYFIASHDIPQEMPPRREGDQPRTRANTHYYLIIRQGKTLLNSKEGRVFLGQGKAAAQQELTAIFENNEKTLKRYKQVAPQELQNRCTPEVQDQVIQLINKEGQERSAIRSIADCVGEGCKTTYNTVAGVINSLFS